MGDREINGYQNECEFSKYLNGRKIKNLNLLFQDFIHRLYGIVNEDLYVKCNVDYNKKKYDIIININNDIRRISIKKGIKNSVHAESISSFKKFLNDIGIDRKIIVEYLKYHYADGTINGTGEKRLSGEEYKQKHHDKINMINSAINKDYVINEAIERFVIRGKNQNEKIDAIIYGIVNDFMYITSDEIRYIILSKNNINSNGVHFANLYCQPMIRNLNKNPKYERNRFYVQIKWYSLFDDIIEYLNNKTLNKIIV